MLFPLNQKKKKKEQNFVFSNIGLAQTKNKQAKIWIRMYSDQHVRVNSLLVPLGVAAPFLLKKVNVEPESLRF